MLPLLGPQVRSLVGEDPRSHIAWPKINKKIKINTPLPKNHGRLIDADAFCKILKQVSDERRYDTLFSDNLLSVADVFNAIISDLKGTSIDGYMNAPTIIEADGGGAE